MEKALLVGIILGKENKKDIYDQLIELEQLANTAGANSLSTVFQHRKKPDPATYIGKGKLETILNQPKELNCSLIIFFIFFLFFSMFILNSLEKTLFMLPSNGMWG